MVLLVVLLQQALPVVIAVWSAHHGVDVIPARHPGALETDRALVIEFDVDDGTLDAVVEWLVYIDRTCPGEVQQIGRSYVIDS